MPLRCSTDCIMAYPPAVQTNTAHNKALHATKHCVQQTWHATNMACNKALCADAHAMAPLPLPQGVGLSHPWDFQAFLGSLDELLLEQANAQAASSATKRLDKGSRGAPFFRRVCRLGVASGMRGAAA